MPASLYHPAFQRWRIRAADHNFGVPAEVVAATVGFMEAASVLYHFENDRKAAIRPHLQEAIKRSVQHAVNFDFDGKITIPASWTAIRRSVPVLVVEEEHESADSNQDATIQAAFSMRSAWFDDDMTVFRNLACCPTFLLGLSGAHLVISVAVLTDKLIVERLASLWVGRSSTHDKHQTRVVSRALYAFSFSIDELQEWYKSLHACIPFDEEKIIPANHTRFFPFVCRYPLDAENFANAVEFEYRCPLQPNQSTCVAFRATTKESNPKEVVVKFVQRYCREAHDILAIAGMAPALLYYGRIDPDVDYGDWKMVVMEYFDGKPSYEDNRHRERVMEAIQLVHAEGYVLGDIRPPNVMVGEECEVRLIDFDWAGGDECALYPPLVYVNRKNLG
ncbi:hypothetical protein BDN70DRAFT_820684 [Pholiota conissans]|uniref:Protein kinase domain-containing protein n=1 Tax=Pholiota conissans TaxID=109636 RepID=A0A9P5YJC9_9AGAR|nr:hypothetical protein BDN70DRAFT_820684 [Pholiota conissans]